MADAPTTVALFEPLTLRSVTFGNRVFVSPMCMYSSIDGMPTDFHLVHLGARAAGGAGLVIVEASAVVPEGRITPADSGIWSDAHAAAFQRITAFIKGCGSVAGIQLAHAGRKASTGRPWDGGRPLSAEQGGWPTVAPSAVAFDAGWPVPRELAARDLDALEQAFEAATRRAAAAGFDVVEVHMAHGYLLHEFLSPLSNQRTDAYGGGLENRMRFPLRIARAVRGALPQDKPVFVRISATDWAAGGWDLPQSVRLARQLKDVGIDLVDCSSGGLVPHAKVPVGPSYQVPFAAALRQEAGIATGAVGMITDPQQANAIVADGQADAVLLAREMLRNPYWPRTAALALGAKIAGPVQYGRAW